MKKVYILTFHNALNYGAVLQCAALYKTISQFIECSVIDYRSSKIEETYKIYSKSRSLKSNIRGILMASRTRLKRNKFNSFLDENVRMTKPYFNVGELKSENWQKDDIFCVGSDQVWNFDLTDKDTVYFFTFISDQFKKISYAASLGKSLSNEDVPYFKKYLSQFNSISVREKTAQQELAENNIDCIQNIDPVYLLDKSDWEALSVKVKEEETPYVLVYLLQKSNGFMKKITEFAKNNHKHIVIITAIALKKIPGVTYIETCSPQEFIRYFLKADVIFTNSFHGISLSIIMNKLFYFEYLEGKYKTNSRLKDTIALFNLDKLDSKQYEEIPSKMNIEYTPINELIKKEQKRSLEYLENAIK